MKNAVMFGFVVLVMAIVVKGLEMKGEGEPIFHHDLPDDMAFDVCARNGARRPEFVRLINKKYNTSFTAGVNGGGIEQMYHGGNIGFGIYPTDDPSILTIQAWNVEYSKAAKLTINVTSGTIVNQEVFSDFATVMCFNDVDANNHHVVKRGVIWDAIKYALRRVCGHFLDLSLMGYQCSMSTTGVCLAVAASLEVAIPIPGDSVFWFPACNWALFAVCDEIGYRDPTSLQVCAAIENYIRDHLG